MSHATGEMPAKDVLDSLCWPVSRLGEALRALARRGGLGVRGGPIPVPPAKLIQPDNVALERWLEGTADWLGVEAELLETPYAGIPVLLRACGPCVIRLHWRGDLFLAVPRGGRRWVTVLGPDLRLHRVSTETLRAVLCWDIEAPLLPVLEPLVQRTGASPSRRARMREALLRERIHDVNVRRCWHLRLPPEAPFLTRLRRAGLGRRLLLLLSAHAVGYGLWLGGWWAVGRGALSDRLDGGVLWAWALLLVTLVPPRLLSTWWGGSLALDTGGLLKQRLLAGALRVEADEVRHQGAGQLLGRVLEAGQVESLGLSGGMLGLVAGGELLVAAAVLARGPGGVGHALVLGAWVGLCVVLGVRSARWRIRWARTRLDLTHALVERLVGHRTRLAQEPPARWHEGEDPELEHYLAQSKRLDGTLVGLEGFLPRGWLVLGVAGLVPAFAGGQTSPAALAVGLGGVLLAYQSLHSLLVALAQLSGAWVAWRQVAPLFHAATRVERALPRVVASPPDESEPGALLEARGLVFRYQARGLSTLQGCDVRIHPGERLLLEGPSGGGKSTLGALLTGLREPSEGVLLLEGLDRRTLGPEGWRRRVVAAPQFQENHILTGSLAFNLLMGRAWPPRPGDLEAAAELCRALGLGPLLARMPAGLEQWVGETGWQLSHGERSRVYIARALLQGSRLVVLDESFGALDPQTLRTALCCVLERAPTVLVIAHP